MPLLVNHGVTPNYPSDKPEITSTTKFSLLSRALRKKIGTAAAKPIEKLVFRCQNSVRKNGETLYILEHQVQDLEAELHSYTQTTKATSIPQALYQVVKNIASYLFLGEKTNESQNRKEKSDALTEKIMLIKQSLSGIHTSPQADKESEEFFSSLFDRIEVLEKQTKEQSSANDSVALRALFKAVQKKGSLTKEEFSALSKNTSINQAAEYA